MKSLYVRCLVAVLLTATTSTIAQTTTVFSYTGGMQSYTVPTGVTFLDVDVRGAEGGAGTGTGAVGGTGSTVTGRFTVTPGTTLYIFVGSAGTAFSGGFNGGGNPGSGGGGGGGASDIRIGGTQLSNRVIVAGGGGGGGSSPGYAGGKGGSLNGENGSPSLTLGGKGGTQSIGGPGGGTGYCGGAGLAGGMGSFGQGANAAGGTGAGGGGFYGGGSGGSNIGGTCDTGFGGGGGGSSNISTSVVSNASISQGGNFGNGSITIIAPNTPTAATTGFLNVTAGSATLTGLAADRGANTTIVFEYSTNPAIAANVITVPGKHGSIAAGTGTTADTAHITGLNANTTYYFRIRATNSVGTVAGSIMSFTTPNNAPFYVSGAQQSLEVCQNTSNHNLTSRLHVMDTDPQQTLVWTIAETPNKGGTLGGFSGNNTANSGSANIAPGTTVNYMPAPAFSGTETFSIQVSDGKGADTMWFTVKVNPMPVPLITRNGSTISTGNFIQYQWYKGNVAIVGGTTASYTIEEAGEYHVVVTDTNGCMAESNIFKFPPVSVDEVNGNDGIRIFPNPATDRLYVEAPEAVTTVICSIDGKVAIRTADKLIDVSTLPAGVWLLKLYSANGALLKLDKLVKQ